MIKWWLLVGLFAGLLNAKSVKVDDRLIDLFVQEGSGKLAQEIERIVQDKKTWLDYLERKDVRYGFFNTTNHLILANKADKTLEVYDVRNHQLKRYKHLGQELPSSVLFGSVEGDKQLEGDKKTPVGLYEFVRKKDKQNLKRTFGAEEADKYGPLAYVTTYPNLMDQFVYNKTGFGIWLHGKPTDPSRKFDTRGCIAIDNDELVGLDGVLDFKKTVMIISAAEPVQASKSEVALILANLYQWKSAWQRGDFGAYWSFYRDSFVHFVGVTKRRDKQNFLTYKKKIFHLTKMANIDFKRANIVPYMEASGRKIFKISFKQNYSSNLLPNGVWGKKNLYVYLQNDKMNILIEESAKMK